MELVLGHRKYRLPDIILTNIVKQTCVCVFCVFLYVISFKYVRL